MAKISKEVKAQAEAIGAQAHKDGLPVVPAMCKEINEMLKSFPISKGAVEVMKAFQQGWAKEMYRATVAGN